MNRKTYKRRRNQLEREIESLAQAIHNAPNRMRDAIHSGHVSAAAGNLAWLVAYGPDRLEALNHKLHDLVVTHSNHDARRKAILYIREIIAARNKRNARLRKAQDSANKRKYT